MRVLNRIKIVTHLFLHVSSKAGTSGLPFPGTYRLWVTLVLSGETSPPPAPSQKCRVNGGDDLRLW